MTIFKPIQQARLSWIEGIPYSLDGSDIYFSGNEGLKESKHVFIDGNRLIERWCHLQSGKCEPFVIGEIGFGTGLNFLLAWSLWDQYASKHTRLHYMSCEKNPLSLMDLKKSCELWPELKIYAQQLIDKYPILTPGFHCLEFDHGRVILNLMLGDALTCYQDLITCGDARIESVLGRNQVDAWFLDGFAPQKNPDAWTTALFETIALLSKSDTTLSTFSAAGIVKNGLKWVGFEIKKQPGYGKKREMVVATFQSSCGLHHKRKTPWHVSQSLIHHERKAIVIGAGLAGCSIAAALAKQGWKIALLDSHSKVGQGASGNPAAVLFPLLSAYSSPLTQFMLSAFLYAHSSYQTFLDQGGMGDLSGLLYLISSTEKLQQWLNDYPELGQKVSALEASQLAEVPIHTEALFVPKSGWIHLPTYCEYLANTHGIEFFPETSVAALAYDNDKGWHAAGHQAPILIIANGHLAHEFTQTKHLAITPVSGQMTACSIDSAQHLRMPICEQGHVVPYSKNLYWLGATFHANSVETNCHTSDDVKNFATTSAMAVDLNLTSTLNQHWAGVRATTLDHLPLVGPVANAALLSEKLAPLMKDPNRWISYEGEYYQPGLYLFTGFGSRGLTTIPLSAAHLASVLTHSPDVLPRKLIQAISPSRFLFRRKIKR